MKWNKAKSILIVFFIIIDALLLLYITADKIHSNRIEGTIADTVTELLNKRNISVDKKIITGAAKNKNLKPVYAKNIIDDYSEFAKKIIGENVREESNNRFYSDIGMIMFDGDYFEASAFDGKTLYQYTPDSDGYEKCALSYITSIGAVTGKLKGMTNKNSSEISVSFKEKINGLEVFGAGLIAEFDGYGLKKISGNWYNEQGSENDLMELKSPSGALIEYMNKKQDDSEVVIEDICIGFASLQSNTYHESIMLTPVWGIKEKGGKEVYINAREK